LLFSYLNGKQTKQLKGKKKKLPISKTKVETLIYPKADPPSMFLRPTQQPKIKEKHKKKNFKVVKAGEEIHTLLSGGFKRSRSIRSVCWLQGSVVVLFVERKIEKASIERI